MLSDCGLVHRINRISKAGIPLRGYEDLKAFKLFVVDVGLLGCMAGLHQQALLDSVRTSMADYKKEEWIISLPLYAIDQIAHI